MNNAKNGKRGKFPLQSGQGSGRSRVTGDNQHFDPAFHKVSRCLQGVAGNGFLAFGAVWQTGGISKIDKIFVGHFILQGFENCQASHAGVKDPNGQMRIERVCHELFLKEVVWLFGLEHKSLAFMAQKSGRKMGSSGQPRYSLSEEIVNSVSHGLGILLSVAGLGVLTVFSALLGVPFYAWRKLPYHHGIWHLPFFAVLFFCNSDPVTDVSERDG